LHVPGVQKYVGYMVDENWSVEGAVKIRRCISLTQNVQGKFSLMMKAVGKYIMK
jgi:hypothetical protein